MLNRMDRLRGMTDEEVRAWLSPRRASWRIAVDNVGVDGNVGSIVRGHNAFAGGGLHIVGRRRWHRGVAMGTQHYEPITDAWPTRYATVEADARLPAVDPFLHADACYGFGHDRVGPSPDFSTAATARFGPPTGWGESSSPALLAHLVMRRLRLGLIGDAPWPEPAGGIPMWEDGWDRLLPSEQRARLDGGWWTSKPWEDRLDWWLWMPRVQYPLNAVAAYRVAHAAGARGIIVGRIDAPAREHRRPVSVDPLRWRELDVTAVSEMIRMGGYPLVGLEQGGETPERAMPARGILQLGHERDGLEPLINLDDRASVEQWGSGRSINVAMAAGLALDAVIRR